MRKSVQLLLDPPQIPHSLYWYRTWTSTVTGQQLRARIMPRPYSVMNHRDTVSHINTFASFIFILSCESSITYSKSSSPHSVI